MLMLMLKYSQQLCVDLPHRQGLGLKGLHMQYCMKVSACTLTCPALLFQPSRDLLMPQVPAAALLPLVVAMQYWPEHVQIQAMHPVIHKQNTLTFQGCFTRSVPLLC